MEREVEENKKGNKEVQTRDERGLNRGSITETQDFRTQRDLKSHLISLALHRDQFSERSYWFSVSCPVPDHPGQSPPLKHAA